MRKKLVAMIAAAVMCFALTLTANAATTSDIISKLKADGASATVVAQAEDFFKSNSGSFTSAQLDTVSANLTKVEDIMKTNNVTDPTKLPAAAKEQVKAIVADTASATGITAEFSKNSSGITVLTVSKNGVSYSFATNDGIPKTTGSDNTLAFIALAAGLLIVAGSIAEMLSRRRNAVAE